MIELKGYVQRATEIHAVLANQYRAALAMMKEAIEQCPEDLWNSSQGHRCPFWQVAFHGLFFAHFYLQLDHHKMTRWSKHRGQVQDLDAPAGEPYTKDELLEYLQLVGEMLEPCLSAMDLESSDCGFPWYGEGKLEHQINNIRHIQHHAALLAGRVRMATGNGPQWR